MAYPCNNVRTGVYFSVTEKNGSVPLCSKKPHDSKRFETQWHNHLGDIESSGQFVKVCLSSG